MGTATQRPGLQRKAQPKRITLRSVLAVYKSTSFVLWWNVSTWHALQSLTHIFWWIVSALKTTKHQPSSRPNSLLCSSNIRCHLSKIKLLNRLRAKGAGACLSNNSKMCLTLSLIYKCSRVGEHSTCKMHLIQMDNSLRVLTINQDRVGAGNNNLRQFSKSQTSFHR